MVNNIRIFKGPGCPAIDKEVLTIVLKFIKFAIAHLKLEDQAVVIRLLGSSTQEPITTGAYMPQTKTICTIAECRNPIDYCRTIAHELTHMRQDVDGKLAREHPEIGGEIEDDANVQAGIIVKTFIKSVLTLKDRKKLGLGTYGI